MSDEARDMTSSVESIVKASFFELLFAKDFHPLTADPYSSI
jgi:hypothetical protein